MLLGANTSPNERIEGRRAGADACLDKPFHEEELRLVIQNLLELRLLWQKRYAARPNPMTPFPPDMHEAVQKEDAFMAKMYAVDSVRVRLLTSDNPEGYPVSIPVSPAILLSNGGHALQGFGIEQTEVTVTLRGVSSGVPVPVSLIATNGIVSPTEITLKPGEVKKVFFRSRGISQGTLRAHSSGNDSADLSITYRFPWEFLLAALLGGVTGAWFNFIRQPASTPKQEKHAFGYYLKNGIPLALFAALLYAIGVNVLEGRFPTYVYFSEAVTMLFSAIVTALNIDIFAPFRK